MDETSATEIGSAASVAENARTRYWLERRFPLAYKTVTRLRPPHPFLCVQGEKNRERFSALIAALGPDPWTLDIGAGTKASGNVAGISAAVAPQVIAFDISPTPVADIVGDAHRLPFLSNSLQGVLIQGVLEHVREPRTVIAEIERVLVSGGIVYCEVPFLQHYHQDPEDYRRYTHVGLKAAFSAFEELQAGVLAGPTSALCDVLTEYPSVWFESPLGYWGVKWVLGWGVLPLRYLDHVAARRPRAKAMAGALYFMGRKRSPTRHTPEGGLVG